MQKHHTINYIEFPAIDLDAIKKFYQITFGWTLTDYGPTYSAFNDGNLDGGFELGKQRDGNSPLVILYSESLHTTLLAIEQNGGTITKSIYDFPGGRRFHFTDPSSNELAVWSEV